MKITNDFDQNLKILRECATDCPDYIINVLKMKDGTRFILMCVDNMANNEILTVRLLPWLLDCNGRDFDTARLPIADYKTVLTLDDALAGIATGGVFFLVEGHLRGFQSRIEKLVGRSPETSDAEKTERGPRDSFVENLPTNLAILRTRIANHDLKFKKRTLGASTHQNIAVAYLQGLADPQLLQELERRLDDLNYDGFLCTAYVEQMIADDRHSPFPQCNVTERVDKAEAALLEGRFLILVQGAPNALILPVSFWSFFQSMDDFTHPALLASVIGTFRVIGVLLAVILPAAYVAILSYHYYIVPLNLLATLAASRAGVLFTPLGEALLMGFLFEIIREASLRLPSSIGSTVGIVGGIIIGETAIQAGLVSNLMVVIVAITAVAGFVLPSHDLEAPMRYLRFFMMILAGCFGLIGLSVGASLVLLHLMNLRSLGQPYMQPAFPFETGDWRNTIVRLNFRILRHRPATARPRDTERGKNRE